MDLGGSCSVGFVFALPEYAVVILLNQASDEAVLKRLSFEGEFYPLLVLFVLLLLLPIFVRWFEC